MKPPDVNLPLAAIDNKRDIMALAQRVITTKRQFLPGLELCIILGKRVNYILGRLP